MFSPCLPLFAFGNANFPSLPPQVNWVLSHQHPLILSVTLPPPQVSLPWAELCLQWSSSGSLRAEFGLARQRLRAGRRAGDDPGGLPWALSPALCILAARAAPRLWGVQSGVLETAPPLASPQNEWEKTVGWGGGGLLQKRIILRLTKSLKNQLLAAEKLLKVCEWWLKF